MAIDPDIQPHLDALTDRIVRVEARATHAEQDLAIIEPSIAQLEQTVAALERATAELIAAAPRLIAALLERAVTAEADRDEAERRERTAVNLANYHRGVAREAGRRADAARPPAPTESTPDPPYQPVAGRPTMDLLDRGTDR